MSIDERVRELLDQYDRFGNDEEDVDVVEEEAGVEVEAEYTAEEMNALMWKPWNDCTFAERDARNARVRAWNNHVRESNKLHVNAPSSGNGKEKPYADPKKWGLNR